MERLRRLALDHRRLIAAVLAGVAVLTALASVETQQPERRAMVVAATDLASGALLGPGDVREVDADPLLVPDGAAGEVREVVGQRVSGPMRRGGTITDARILGPDALQGRPEGTVLTTVRIADPIELEGLGAGDLIDVVAVLPRGEDGRPSASVVAQGLEVVATDPGESDVSDAATLRVAVEPEAALALAEASLDARLGVVATGREDTPRGARRNG